MGQIEKIEGENFLSIKAGDIPASLPGAEHLTTVQKKPLQIEDKRAKPLLLEDKRDPKLLRRREFYTTRLAELRQQEEKLGGQTDIHHQAEIDTNTAQDKDEAARALLILRQYIAIHKYTDAPLPDDPRTRTREEQRASRNRNRITTAVAAPLRDATREVPEFVDGLVEDAVPPDRFRRVLKDIYFERRKIEKKTGMKSDKVNLDRPAVESVMARNGILIAGRPIQIAATPTTEIGNSETRQRIATPIIILPNHLPQKSRRAA